MNCPGCFARTRVIDSRPLEDGRLGVRRRRECEECGHRFTTDEIAVELRRGRQNRGGR